MKLTKRIIALVVVLCTLGAMMVPGVAAEDPSKDLVVNFSGADGDFAKLELANGTTITAATINAAYEKGTIKWGLHATDTRALQVKMTSLWMMMRQYSNAPHSNVALSFKAPADGKYTLSIGYGQYSTQSTQVDAFVIPTPETALTNNSGTLRTTVAALRAEGAALITIPGNAATGTYDSGDKTVDLTGGQEYLLILAAIGETGVNYYDYFTGFSLIWDSALEGEAPEVTYDYSVSYNANYPDAEAIPADSLTSAEASVEFTAKTLTREGYTFEGWATSAESNEVAYAAGATITLISESPSLELYAVWTEISTEPEVSNDLVVDFNADFEELGLSTNNTVLGSSGANVNQYYGDKIDWSIDATDCSGPNLRKLSGLWLQIRRYGANSPWANIALRFKAPADGKFTLELGRLYYANDKQPTSIKAYVTEALESPLTSGNTSGPASLRGVVSALEAANAELISTTENATTTYTSGEKTVELIGGKEYLLVITTDGVLGEDYRVYFKGFSLLYKAPLDPVASIGSENYATLDAALAAAVSGDTIVLDKNASADGLDLTVKGVTLDLNGKTLTATAVTGSVIDSSDGNGKIAGTANAPVITTAENNIVLCDNTGDAPCYRIYTYDFKAIQSAKSGTDEAQTAVDENIHFYDFEANYLPEEFEKRADNKLADVKDAIKNAYDAKNIGWYYDAASENNAGYVDGTVVVFSSGFRCLSLRSQQNGWYAFRFRAPADGNMSLTLQTDRVGTRAAATFNAYVVKASDLDETPDYDAVIAANDPLFTECYCEQGDEFITDPAPAFAKGYNFEANAEYVLILVNTGAAGSYIRLSDISFTRAARDERMAQTFWSQLSFNNVDAYTVIAMGGSGLKTGFDMKWNGTGKVFDFDADTLMGWANEEATKADKDYGFYIRVAGFEVLNETGVLTAQPYVSGISGGKTADLISYEYTAN